MRVLLASGHRYPADDRRSAGTRPRAEPSGAPGAVHDLLARGLAELGHEVLYLLAEPPAEPLPPGVAWVDAPDPGADVWHGLASQSVPWVATCHGRWPGHRGGRRWIYVSRSLAHWFGSERFVYNGLDPADFVYRETRGDYLLFLGSLERRLDKGLDVALAVAAAAGLPLKVAGAACDLATFEETAAECAAHGAELVGDVRGAEKAELLAGARALIFPSRVAEGFGLAIAEALMSGTPVVAGDRGACPELVAPEVGFCCRDERQWIEALGRLDEIDPAACRARALAEHHYRVMTERYVAEYEREIAARPRGARPAAVEAAFETGEPIGRAPGPPTARSQWPPPG
jgi:glycosyltransferase involved in cell wall biosynthesis